MITMLRLNVKCTEESNSVEFSYQAAAYTSLFLENQEYDLL